MVQLGHTGVYVGRGEVWVCGGKEKYTHVHEEYAHIDVFTQFFVSFLSLSRVTVCWTREKVLPTRCSLIGEPTQTCIVGHSPSSPRW